MNSIHPQTPQKQPQQVRAYRVTFRGEYIAYNEHGGRALPKFYKNATFILPEYITYKKGMERYYEEVGKPGEKGYKKTSRERPEIVKSHILHCYKFIVKNYYIERWLKDNVPNFRFLRTLEPMGRPVEVLVDSMYVRDLEEVPIEDMREDELIRFVMMKDLEVELNSYEFIEEKREAVQRVLDRKAEQDEGFKASQTTTDPLLSAPTNVSVDRSGVQVSTEDPIAKFK